MKRPKISRRAETRPYGRVLRSHWKLQKILDTTGARAGGVGNDRAGDSGDRGRDARARGPLALNSQEVGRVVELPPGRGADRQRVAERHQLLIQLGQRQRLDADDLP